MRAEIGDREFRSGGPQSRRHAQNRSPLSPAQPLLGKTEKRATTSLHLLPRSVVCCPQTRFIELLLNTKRLYMMLLSRDTSKVTDFLSIEFLSYQFSET